VSSPWYAATPWYEAYWVALGLLVGWVWWKVPILIERIRQWKRDRVQADIDRIEGAFIPDAYTPIQAPPPSIRERILEYWRQWNEETKPRRPEDVAQMVYQQEGGAAWL